MWTPRTNRTRKNRRYGTVEKRKAYETPVAEIIELDRSDVITASPGTELPPE